MRPDAEHSFDCNGALGMVFVDPESSEGAWLSASLGQDITIVPRGPPARSNPAAYPDLRMSLDKTADMACLSPTRFAHLFKDQVGLPFSRYMLWRKLTRAMVAIGVDAWRLR